MRGTYRAKSLSLSPSHTYLPGMYKHSIDRQRCPDPLIVHSVMTSLRDLGRSRPVVQEHREPWKESLKSFSSLGEEREAACYCASPKTTTTKNNGQSSHWLVSSPGPLSVYAPACQTSILRKRGVWRLGYQHTAVTNNYYGKSIKNSILKCKPLAKFKHKLTSYHSDSW